MWISIRTGRVSTSVFEQSHIVISVGVRATVTGVHNLNSSSFLNDIKMDYSALSCNCQDSNSMGSFFRQVSDNTLSGNDTAHCVPAVNDWYKVLIERC